jgi:hypothetical protein
MPWAAKLFDWAKDRGGKVLQWARRHWRKASVPVRAVVVVLAVGVGSLAGLGAYRVIFG